jgi:hypothetical protein
MAGMSMNLPFVYRLCRAGVGRTSPFATTPGGDFVWAANGKYPPLSGHTLAANINNHLTTGVDPKRKFRVSSGRLISSAGIVKNTFVTTVTKSSAPDQ